MNSIRSEGLSLTFNNQNILQNVSVNFTLGQLTVLVGPNGCGKTSLFRSLLGIQVPTLGHVYFSDKPMDELSTVEKSRLVSYLPQTRSLAWPLLVNDIVRLGRFSYGISMGSQTPESKREMHEIMKSCGIEHLAMRKADTLSGGELARVHCARTLFANATFIFADEPVAALDPKHQLSVMTLLRDYADEAHGAVVVLHDISLAARFADRIVWMKNGAIISDGSVADTLHAEQLKAAFDIDATVDKINGVPVVSIEASQ